jgi:hypothetical protein
MFARDEIFNLYLTYQVGINSKQEVDETNK